MNRWKCKGCVHDDPAFKPCVLTTGGDTIEPTACPFGGGIPCRWRKDIPTQPQEGSDDVAGEGRK